MSVTGKEAQILDIILAEVAGKSYGSPALPFAMPDIAFDPSANPRYIAVDCRFNKPGLQSLDTGGLVQKLGILELTVVWEKNKGIIQAQQVVGQIIADWPRGKLLYGYGLKVSIPSAAYPAGQIKDDTRTSHPILIPWQVLDHS